MSRKSTALGAIKSSFLIWQMSRQREDKKETHCTKNIKNNKRPDELVRCKDMECICRLNVVKLKSNNMWRVFCVVSQK